MNLKSVHTELFSVQAVRHAATQAYGSRCARVVNGPDCVFPPPSTTRSALSADERRNRELTFAPDHVAE